MAEVVADRETGILVPPGDVEALSQAIKYLWENPEVAAPKFEEVYNSVG